MFQKHVELYRSFFKKCYFILDIKDICVILAGRRMLSTCGKGRAVPVLCWRRAGQAGACSGGRWGPARSSAKHRVSGLGFGFRV